MCGRATLITPADEVARVFDVAQIPIGPPRYNLAPSQPILVVRTAKEERELALVRWGLVPWWAKPDEMKKLSHRCVQARSETVETAPAFRDAFKGHRCLVVIDGYFEWKTLADGRRVPHHTKKRSGEPLAVAGVWDTWRAPDGERVESCAVLTTRAAGPVRRIHDRMPLVLGEAEWSSWLTGSPDDAHALLAAARADEARADDLVVVPVSTWVNDVRHDDPRCIEPETPPSAEPAQELGFSFTPPKRSRSR